MSRGYEGLSLRPPDRRITGTFRTETISVPRVRVEDEDGKVREWRSKALPGYRQQPIPPPDQDPDLATLRRNRVDAALGLAGLGQITMRKVDGWQTELAPLSTGHSGITMEA
jgi:hypothetical protein